MSLGISSFVSVLKAEAAGAASKPLSREKPKREILPIEKTPSLICTDWEDYKIDSDRSFMKSLMRVEEYWLKAFIEGFIKTPFSRGTTCLQGAQARGKFQAAHFSLMPNAEDRLLDEVVSSLVQKQMVTPKRTGPYLRHRANFSSPDFRNLQFHLKDPRTVREIIVERLPERGESSCLAGTVFENHCNATFDNPDRSNEFDSILETEISGFLKNLQRQRIAGELDANESTAQLVRWLAEFYQESVKNNLICLERINALCQSHFALMAIEESYQLTGQIAMPDIRAYLQAAVEFLDAEKKLNRSSMRGTARLGQIQQMRSYCKALKTLIQEHQKSGQCTKKNWIECFEGKNELPVKIDPDEMKRQYAFFIQEAKAQEAGIQDYFGPEGIQNLIVLFFGVMKDGNRFPPTEEELREQVFGMLTPIEEPSIEFRKRAASGKENENISNEKDDSVLQPFKRPRTDSVVRSLFPASKDEL